MTDFTLGQRATWHTSNELLRTSLQVQREFGTRTRKVWRSPSDAGIVHGGQERSGVIIGTRVLSNGWLRYLGHDEPVEYILDGTVRVLVLAYDLRRVPVYVQPHLIRPEESHG